MKISQANIIMVPGYTNSGPDHWQSRWQKKIKTAIRVEQNDWHKPVVEEWTQNLVSLVDKTQGPLVFIAHSLGCHVVLQSVKLLNSEQLQKIKGAFLVAPPDVENPAIRPKHLMTFGPYPRQPLPFPSLVLASQNDHFCEQPVAEEMAKAWNSLFVDARESGHINAQSGHGPWPDGLMVFANFMKQL